MLWIVIGAIVAYVIYKFAMGMNDLQQKTLRDGGMLVKYHHLISAFMELGGARISYQTSTDVAIMGNIGIVSFNILIMQAMHERLIVTLKMNGPLLKDVIKKEWNHKETETVENITTPVILEIVNYVEITDQLA